jgi:hypothetical protein
VRASATVTRARVPLPKPAHESAGVEDELAPGFDAPVALGLQVPPDR